MDFNDFVEANKRKAEELRAELKAELAGVTLLDWLCLISFCGLVFVVGYEWGFEAGLENYREIVEAAAKR